MAPSSTELPFIGKNSKPRERSSYHTLERGYVANQSPGNEEESSMNVYLVLSMESEAAQAIFSLLTWADQSSSHLHLLMLKN